MTQDQIYFSWKKPFFIASASLLVLLLANNVAIKLYLYYGYPWIDIPMHFLGGFSVGIAAIGLLRIVYTKESYNKAPLLIYIACLTFCVGVLWEFAEWHYNVSVAFGGNFWFDTYKDLLMDTLGGILSYICFRPHKKNLPTY